MKSETMNTSSIQINESDSPKTPGGISKSFLTPCRRVGLSRKWKNSGISPFISPLSSTNSNLIVKDNDIRKRKNCDSEAEENNSGVYSSEELSSSICNTPKIDINRTPTRNLLARKKSKTFLTTQMSEEVEDMSPSISEIIDTNNVIQDDNVKQDILRKGSEISSFIVDNENVQKDKKQVSKVSKLSRKNSKSINDIRNLNNSPVKNTITPSDNVFPSNKMNLESIHNENIQNKDTHNVVKATIKSPNNLTKECMVVIQKKIFKCDEKANYNKSINIKQNETKNNTLSENIFDSDTDDVPLSDLKNTSNVIEENIKYRKGESKNTIHQNLVKTNDAVELNSQSIICHTNIGQDDFDFVDKKKVKAKKLTPTTDLKKLSKVKQNRTKVQTKSSPKPIQSSILDENDDFDYTKSRTILLKRTYNKVTKPVRAKSTESITQRDIDELQARIESKRNLLLAKAMTDETKELRDLIKKWQIGCQTALIELMDLMKKKLPDQNMERSELLQMLKIPPDLVAYDSDSDSFNSQDDATIILSALKLN